LALAILLAFAAIGEDAVFAELTGKVEYQAPGGAWKPAKVGDRIGVGVLVSTGFKSTALLKLGATTITVKPVTRLTLQELIKTEGGTQTKLYLLSGRVKADVPPQPGQTTDFKITSPTATASVRGTSFEFDGFNLIVDRGSVQLMTPAQQYRYVSAGEFSTLSRTGVVLPPATVTVAMGLARVGELVKVQEEEIRATASTPPPLAEPTTVDMGFVVTVN
jgi:hypothetical protein